MQTPWGEIAVSDAHVHFFSQRFFEALGAQSEAPQPKGDLPHAQDGTPGEGVARRLQWEMPGDARQLAKRWAAELDRHGVARAALIGSVPGDEDSVAIAAGAQPARFFAYAMFNPLAAEAPARAQAAFAAGIRALCLFPAMHRFSMHDDRVDAVLEIAASEPHRAVFVHCGVLTVGVRKKLGLASPFDMRYCNPLDLHSAALRYCKLPFIVPHFGAGYFREALMLADLCPNVYLDTSSGNSWMRYEELDLPTVFRRALAIAGPARLLFGTDSSYFPRGWNQAIFEQQAHVLHSLDVAAPAARLIFGENLESLFGPPVSADKAISIPAPPL